MMKKYRIISKKSIMDGYRQYTLQRKTLFGWRSIRFATEQTKAEAYKIFYKQLKPKNNKKDYHIDLIFDDSRLIILRKEIHNLSLGGKSLMPKESEE